MNCEELIQRKDMVGRKLMKRSLPLENTIVFGADSPKVKARTRGRIKYDENGAIATIE